jgi:hypothetical protein
VAAERARDFPQNLPLAANGGPVYLLGTGERCRDSDGQPTRHSRERGNSELHGSNHWPWTPLCGGNGRSTSSRAFRVAGPKAFAEAGIAHDDVDHPMIQRPRLLPRGKLGASTDLRPKTSALCRAARPTVSLPSATPPLASPGRPHGRPPGIPLNTIGAFATSFRHVRVAGERAPDVRHRLRQRSSCERAALAVTHLPHASRQVHEALGRQASSYDRGNQCSGFLANPPFPDHIRPQFEVLLVNSFLLFCQRPE